MLQLTDLWQIIDRSIYEAIRLEVVAQGYLPDITLFDTTTVPGRDAWNTALQHIVDTNGFYIKVFGAGSSHSKFQKTVPRIVYLPKRVFPGDLGGNPDAVYASNGNLYDASVRPPQTSDMQFEVSIVSNLASQERVMNGILGNVFSKRNYINFYTNVGDENDQVFFTRQYSFRDVPDTAFGLNERIYAYEAKDLWDRENAPLPQVHRLDEITVETRLGDDENEPPDDTLVVP